MDSLQTVTETADTPDISQHLCLTSRSHKGRHFSFEDMTAQQIIYNQLKIKGTMEETTGYNGFTPSEYAEELYRDAKVNSQRKQRLQRRLDNLSREQQQNLKHQMKQRIFKAGIEYYEARAEYCYYMAESAYEMEFKIWNDIMLDFMAELDRQNRK